MRPLPAGTRRKLKQKPDLTKYMLPAANFVPSSQFFTSMDKGAANIVFLDEWVMVGEKNRRNFVNTFALLIFMALYSLILL
jgi:hypothetical protein